MAPHVNMQADPQSNPLADYFYIAGIESSSIYDERIEGATSPPVDTTIDEDIALVTNATASPAPDTPATPTGEAPFRRSKRYSFEVRRSRGSIITSPDITSPPSKRNSASTMKGAAAVLSEEDFDQALRKFAYERESFLDEIHVSAGTVTTPSARATPKPRPKTIRIKSSEENAAPSLRSGVGSLRRKLSTMNSMRKTSAPPSRQTSVNTTKRLSGYKSVIPTPEPFKVDPTMHPLKRRYEPVLLDRYPTKDFNEESKRRCPFPDYVPMFAFPNDVSIVSADERPRSTWHGFAMTSSDGSRLYSICVTLWMPLAADASAELERQCEAWRRANMSDEERELASSLGERLAAERAKLSRLLSMLPGMPSESDERENLEDEISGVEERIALMADLLRPVRHAAASKIEGLTQNETGFWAPRVYGILGREVGMTGFWKEWLKAVIVPMTDGGILNVPASSPRVGMWQPLERYVINLCVEAPSPHTSLTQVEVAIRELRLFARKEAINEIPGSRNTDLYALFRALSISTIVSLFECAIAEGRIILLSSHTSMLHLASAALSSILYPLKWCGIFIPVLPSRLLQALDAPCPYIIGVERRYDTLKLPDDDFVLVDLDQDIMEGTAPPKSLPRQIRRKLTSLLQAAAPHHNRFGVPVGPPPYAVETFPSNLFSSENPQLFNPKASPSTLTSNVNMSSSAFSDIQVSKPSPPVFNAFLSARGDAISDRRPSIRPGTGSTTKGSQDSASFAPGSPNVASPLSGSFPPTPVSRSDSAFGMQTGLREKRSGQFEAKPRRSSSVSSASKVVHAASRLMKQQFGIDRINPLRRPSHGLVGGHSPSLSTSAPSIHNMHMNGAGYAPSVYAASSMAASTIFPNVLMQPVKDSESTKWIEGHCMVKRRKQTAAPCSICNEKCSEDTFFCTGCSIQAHAGCVEQTALVCPIAFRPDLIRAAFVRCFASLMYTYRRFLHNASGERRKAGLLYHFNVDAFVKSVPADHAEYLSMLRDTQAFNEFIYERETKRGEDPTIKLFDEIILSKRNRGKTSLFSKSIPAKLDPALMKEPRANQGAPRIPKARTTRKPIPSMLGLAVDLAGMNTENQDPMSVQHHLE
ncbi:hypothetical protein ANO11243_053110 [Dothideomycetidae sp. 11243]|nr:hypothetical protein ANO11243_053110 [fungal sp. No.11243]